jgi:hypothetical protein
MLSETWPRTRFVFTFLLEMGIAGDAVRAEFATYAGDASQEAAWQAALGGTVPMENFENFTGVGGPGTGGDMLAALPSVHVVFDPIVPGVYVDPQWAHSGTKQWCNWAGGAGNSASHVLRPEPGRQILALGFWNTDPQGDQPIKAYDAANQLIGTISGHLNTHSGHPELSDGFAAFISTTPIAYVTIPGALGDGWNHFDDLQVITKVTADYNHNGVVDAADFVVWRATLNQTGSNLAADGSGPAGVPNGIVDSYDYTYWRMNFGNIVGVAVGTSLSRVLAASVPEPTAGILFATGLFALISNRSLRQNRRSNIFALPLKDRIFVHTGEKAKKQSSDCF